MFKGKSDYRKAKDSICSVMQQNCQQFSLCFLLPQVQRVEKKASMIALLVVVLFFLYTADRYLNKCRTRDNVVPPNFNTDCSDSWRVLLKYVRL